MTTAIIGAGIAGLSCAAALAKAGVQVELFDKGKRPGGRLSTLRLDDGAWDFGCQYLRRGDGHFASQVDAWHAAGVVAPWHEGPPGAWVGTPAMASLIDYQSQQHQVRFGALVQRLERRGEGWHLIGPGLEAGPYTSVAIATPAEQAAPLLGLHDLGLAREAAAIRSRSCWTVMASFAAPLAGAPNYLAGHGAIEWAARNSSKPGRPAGECWVIQASAAWSEAHLEDPADDVAAQLVALFAAQLKTQIGEPSFVKAHRWRFAMSYGQPGKVLWNQALRLGSCGDWCTAGHVEGGWRAGAELAERILAGSASSVDARILTAAK